MRVYQNDTRTNVAPAQRRLAAAYSAYVPCALRQSCESCPTTPMEGKLQVVPLLLLLHAYVT